MVIPLATNYEALASNGVSRNLHDLGSVSWRMARERLGAMPRLSTRFMPPHPGFTDRDREAHWGPWTRERSLTVLLDPVAAAHASNVEAIRHLLWIASEKPTLVRVLTFDVSSCEGAVPLRLLDYPSGEPFDLTTETLPESVTVEVREHGAKPRDSWWAGAAIDNWCRRRWERAGENADSAHAKVKRRRLAILLEEIYNELTEIDLLVTADKGWLKRRWIGNHPIGVASPEEADAMASTLLRTCQRIPIKARHGTILQSFNQYAGATAAAMMPRVHGAQISCLAPSRREQHRDLADLLESLISRHADLIRATQRLEEANYLEGYFGGTFTMMGDQFYDLQNALVLASGSADMLASLLAQRAGVEGLPRGGISWGTLTDSRKEFSTRLRERPEIAAIATSVRNHRHRWLIDLTYELRSVYQHRHPLRGCLGVIRSENDEHMYYKSLICLAQNVQYDVWVKKGLKARSHTFPGLIANEYDLYMVPHEFVRGIASATAELLDETVAQMEWPQSDWVQPADSVQALVDERTLRAWP